MSYANSKIPISAQQTVHQDLAKRVNKHLTRSFDKPYASHNVDAFERSLQDWDGCAPIILDSGCGVGRSTITLARQYPDSWVIGIDQSEKRLFSSKGCPVELFPKNMVFVRADLVDYWRLLLDRGLKISQHYLLYPNPWPKIGHLTRRWHAHPVFPYLLQLGGQLECRSNWLIYIQEMREAIHLATAYEPIVEIVKMAAPLTAFEQKYQDSQQVLYRIVCDLEQNPLLNH